MLFVDAGGVLGTCLEHRELQDVRSPLVEHQLARINGSAYLVLSHFVLQFGLHRLKVQAQSSKHVDDGAFLHAEQAQQQVLWAH